LAIESKERAFNLMRHGRIPPSFFFKILIIKDVDKWHGTRSGWTDEPSRPKEITMTEIASLLHVHELRTETASGAKPGEEVPKQDPKQDPADPKREPPEAVEPAPRPMPYTPRD
jgi:hypothetical protein